MKHTKTLGSITYGYEADTVEEVVALIKTTTNAKNEPEDCAKDEVVSQIEGVYRQYNDPIYWKQRAEKAEAMLRQHGINLLN